MQIKIEDKELSLVVGQLLCVEWVHNNTRARVVSRCLVQGKRWVCPWISGEQAGQDGGATCIDLLYTLSLLFYKMYCIIAVVGAALETHHIQTSAPILAAHIIIFFLPEGSK